MNEFASISEILQSRKDKISIKYIKGFDTSIISQIVERVCKTVLYFLVVADWFSSIIVSKFFAVDF